MIYEYALVAQHPLKVIFKEGRLMLEKDPPGMQSNIALGLLLTCKKFNKEATSILYEKNVFRFVQGTEDTRQGHLPVDVFDCENFSSTSYCDKISRYDQHGSLNFFRRYVFTYFLATIGPTNTKHLRRLRFDFEENICLRAYHYDNGQRTAIMKMLEAYGAGSRKIQYNSRCVPGSYDDYEASLLVELDDQGRKAISIEGRVQFYMAANICRTVNKLTQVQRTDVSGLSWRGMRRDLEVEEMFEKLKKSLGSRYPIAGSITFRGSK